MGDDQKTENKVIIYSTDWCGFCHMVEQYLTSKNVKYVVKNIETDRAAYDELMHKLDGNFMGVPVIDIRGKTILGYDRPKIDAALAS
jgi:glutaredoxin-like YruB-family protein